MRKSWFIVLREEENGEGSGIRIVCSIMVEISCGKCKDNACPERIWSRKTTAGN